MRLRWGCHDRGPLCVVVGEGGSIFNCFGQLSKSKLQQMEVIFKTE